VALPGYDEARLLRLARQFGVSRQSGPVKKGQNYLVRGTPGEGVALFRPAKGMYRYYNIEREKTPLNHWGDGTLDTLRGQAAALIRALLGDRASTFAYANHETQWLEMKKAQVPHVSGVTLRYTRQVNGRHIVDNTAYIVVGFAGNNEVYLFEAVDPALTPVPVPRLVMTSATRTRMERNGARMSSFRKTVLPDGKVDIVRVVKVRVAGGCESYVKRTMAGEDFLVPAHSLACVLDLDNGTTGRKRVHLVLDASQATDADESMMEPVAPRR